MQPLSSSNHSDWPGSPNEFWIDMLCHSDHNHQQNNKIHTASAVRDHLLAIVCLLRDRAFEQGTRAIRVRLQILAQRCAHQNPECDGGRYEKMKYA